MYTKLHLQFASLILCIAIATVVVRWSVPTPITLRVQLLNNISPAVLLPTRVLTFLEQDDLPDLSALLPELNNKARIQSLKWNISMNFPLLYNVPSEEQPLVCDFVLGSASRSITQAFTTNIVNYATFQSNQEDSRLRHTICYLTLRPIYQSKLGKIENRMLKYRAARYVLRMIEKGRIVSPMYTTEKPLLLLLDENTFVSNMTMTIFDVSRRVYSGCTYLTAIDQFCNPSPGGSCNIPVNRSLNHRRIANTRIYPSDFFAVMALEVECFRPLSVTSAAMILKANTLSLILLDSVIMSLLAGVRHMHGLGEQGALNYILTEFFGLEASKMRKICQPYNAAFWNLSIQGDQLIFEGTLNRRTLENHYIFKSLLALHMHGYEQVRDANRLIIVNPKWLGASACPVYIRHKQRQSLSWEPSDFVGCFQGCKVQEALNSTAFRERAAKSQVSALSP